MLLASFPLWKSISAVPCQFLIHFCRVTFSRKQAYYNNRMEEPSPPSVEKYQRKEAVRWQKAEKADRAVRVAGLVNLVAAQCRSPTQLASSQQEPGTHSQQPPKAALINGRSPQRIGVQTASNLRLTSSVGQGTTRSSGCFLKSD